MTKLYQYGYGRYMTAARAAELLNRMLIMSGEEIDNMLLSEYVDYCKAVDYATEVLKQLSEGNGGK